MIKREYKIVVESSDNRLQWVVQDYLNKGWDISGGVQIFRPFDSLYHSYAQAIILEVDLGSGAEPI